MGEFGIKNPTASQTDESILDELRLRNLMLLGLACIPFVLPFAIINFLQDHFIVALLATFLIVIAIINSTTIYKKQHEFIPYWSIFTVKLGILLYIIPTLGLISLYWCYPVLMAVYFCAERYKARIMSTVALLTLVPMAYQFLEFTFVLRFAITLFLLLLFCDLLVGITIKLQSRMAELVIRDPLTNAYNRRYMADCLETAIEETKREFGPASLALIDIDHFKKVNDSHGHDAGDRVLKFLVNILHKRQRKLDYVFRIGGEEFVVLLRHTNLEQAQTMAEDLRNNIESTPIISAGGSITISIGVAEYQPDENADNWIKRADDNLYKAKQLGRNRVYPSLQDSELLNTSHH